MDKDKDDMLINEIEDIRSWNNLNWMRILRIALKHAPVETRDVLRDIANNDEQVLRRTKELARD